MQREAFRQPPWFTPGQDQGEVFVITHWAMDIKVRASGLGETTVVASHEEWKISIGGFDGADVAQPQLLYQAILQGEMGSLDAALGLA